jgi:uncharacterized membrane protein YuzA (DUF378 family)
MIAWILVIIGGLNWLLIGVISWGIGDLFGADNMITRVIYIIIGLAALYELFTHKGRCKDCSVKGASGTGM